jgi:hypothetical protein
MNSGVFLGIYHAIALLENNLASGEYLYIGDIYI